jgi:hypothetical protein
MLIGCSTLQAQETQKPDTPFDPKAALTAVYGGNTWRDLTNTRCCFISKLTIKVTS